MHSFDFSYFIHQQAGGFFIAVGTAILIFLVILVYFAVTGLFDRRRDVAMAQMGFEQVTDQVKTLDNDGYCEFQAVVRWQKIKDKSIIDDQIQATIEAMERTVAVIDAATKGMPADGVWKLLDNR